MLRRSLMFLILAFVVAFLGFGGVAATSAGIAKVLFYLFLLGLVVTLMIGLIIGKKAVT